jgi:mannose-binding lectin 2
MQSRWWDFGGNTVVRADQYVRLTGEHPSQSGYLVSRVPLTATNWEVEVEFKIHGTASLFGDGFAMWVTRDRVVQGEVFGMKDNFDGLGIFFDTYKHNRPGTVFPYVMAMLGDGKTPYDKANDGKANEIVPGCTARGLRNPGVSTKAKITYFQDKKLTVDIQYRHEDQYTRCFETGPITLPPIAYLGFSSETGELSDNHDIIRVETKNLYSPTGSTGNKAGNQAPGTAGSADYSRNKGGSSSSSSRSSRSGGGGSWLWFLTKTVLILGFLAGAGYVGFTAYRTRRRDRF